MSKENQKMLTGRVASTKADNTAVVVIVTIKASKLYDKSYKITKRIKAHNPRNECVVGESVKLKPSKPISKGKHYIIVK